MLSLHVISTHPFRSLVTRSGTNRRWVEVEWRVNGERSDRRPKRGWNGVTRNRRNSHVVLLPLSTRTATPVDDGRGKVRWTTWRCESSVCSASLASSYPRLVTFPSLAAYSLRSSALYLRLFTSFATRLVRNGMECDETWSERKVKRWDTAGNRARCGAAWQT